MSLNKIPSWFIVGILIYPLLVLVGLIFSLVTSGTFNFMYWLYLPSVMFNELFKKCCEEIANSSKLLLLFGFVFWFIIGAILGLIVKVIKCSPIISNEEIKIEEKREEEQNKPNELKEEKAGEKTEEQPKTEEKTEENKEEKVEEQDKPAEETSKEEKTETKPKTEEKVKSKPKKQNIRKISKLSKIKKK